MYITEELYEAIKSINPDAAEFLDKPLTELIDKKVKLGHGLTHPCGLCSRRNLSELFVWKFTPQGHNYWKDISDRLPEHLN